MIEFKKFCALTSRNMKCYFKDKFLFLVSLITPMILLTLFVTFLKNVYMDSFRNICGQFGFSPDDRILNGLAGSWLISSVMSVCAVTVAVCSNAVMVLDKVDGGINDFKTSPVKSVTLSLSYFAANFFVTLLVMLAVLAVGFLYLAAVGWCLSVSDVFMIFLDTFCCVFFGTLLAGVIGSLIRSQGALSAVSTLISSLYGFLCGAYMPLSQFSNGIRNCLCLLPGTHSVGIMRHHFMTGYVETLGESGLLPQGQKALLDGFDGNLYFGSFQIPLWTMYTILLSACALLLFIYLAIIFFQNKKSSIK